MKKTKHGTPARKEVACAEQVKPMRSMKAAYAGQANLPALMYPQKPKRSKLPQYGELDHCWKW